MKSNNFLYRKNIDPTAFSGYLGSPKTNPLMENFRLKEVIPLKEQLNDFAHQLNVLVFDKTLFFIYRNFYSGTGYFLYFWSPDIAK